MFIGQLLCWREVTFPVMYIRDKGLNNTDKQLPWDHGERAVLCGRVTVLSQILGAAGHPAKILPNSGLQVGSFFTSQQ